MKLFIFLGILVGLYAYGLMHTTDIVLNQTRQLNATYQTAANNSQELATGR